MALVDVRGFNLQPQAAPLTTGLQELAGFQALGQQNIQREREAQIRQLLGQAGQTQPQTQQQQMLAAQTADLGGEQALAEQPQAATSQQDLIAQARQIDPVIAQKQLKAMGLDDATRRAEASRMAAELQSIPFEQRAERINARAQQLQAQGRDPKDTLQLLNMTEAEQNQALTGIQLLDLSTKERLTFRDREAKAVKLGGPEVKSSKILDDGTTIQSMKDGTTQVISPEGIALTGDARTEAVKKAQKFAVGLQGKRAQQREGGKGAAKIALNAFDQVGKIRSNVSDLQEGIRLVREEGAETGPIVDKLPSFRASTKKLENLRSRLGLNVVGAVTFGALSEGELGLALDVALPKGLNEEETIKWMEDRIIAQKKLANNLEEAALFLSEPGNTVADFIRFTKKRDADAKAQRDDTTKPSEQPEITPQKILKFNPATGRLE